MTAHSLAIALRVVDQARAAEVAEGPALEIAVSLELHFGAEWVVIVQVRCAAVDARRTHVVQPVGAQSGHFA